MSGMIIFYFNFLYKRFYDAVFMFQEFSFMLKPASFSFYKTYKAFMKEFVSPTKVSSRYFIKAKVLY